MSFLEVGCGQSQLEPQLTKLWGTDIQPAFAHLGEARSEERTDPRPPGTNCPACTQLNPWSGDVWQVSNNATRVS